MPLIFPAPIRTYEQEPNFIKKYKTELCKNYEEGNCAFGPSCTFAHGCRELRPKPVLPVSKVKRCKQFAKAGFCENGEQCPFLHVAPIPQRKRLPIFEDIEKRGLSS